MEHCEPVSDVLSPESTVTSLLSNSSHFKSRLQVPELNSTFRYRDKDYESATAALDAYIADFERSRQDKEALVGELVLPHIPLSMPSRSEVSTLRNKDVLKEHLTDRELDFLNLPVSSLHHCSNRDRLSMTTDELMNIPHDGSMPVTHTSAFIQGLLSRSAASQPRLSSSIPAHGSGGHLSSIYNHHPHPTRMHRCCMLRSRTAMIEPDVDVPAGSCSRSSHRAARPEQADPSSSLHLPHWITSNKSKMNFYGVHQHADHRIRAPSWVEDLEDGISDQTSDQVDSRQTLRDLRLQFAEEISLLAAEKNSSDIIGTLYRGNKIESLIQKADLVLSSLSQGSGGARSRSGSVSLADPVEDVSPWNSEEPFQCPPFTQAPAGGVTDTLMDSRDQGHILNLKGSLKQPGPAEAVKQMLFKLQLVETELQRQLETPTDPGESERSQAERTPVKQRPEGKEQQDVSGGASLQSALRNLIRLKMLMEDPIEKQAEGDGEEVEDEGQCSSSSVD